MFGYSIIKTSELNKLNERSKLLDCSYSRHKNSIDSLEGSLVIANTVINTLQNEITKQSKRIKELEVICENQRQRIT